MDPFAIKAWEVAIASAASRAQRVATQSNPVAIASAAEPGAAGRHPFNLGDPAHPTEPIDPCCLPALGEFTG
ncbi:hypothetical protein MINTMi198_03350 [Mycobacterium intracellulare M.i.198]|uniref:Uncharacterized protein n=2 Tax=Mycobacterium avium complex (MAC) TaxID=120793 RepID=A0A7R7RM16_MYCIT|nr:hypothetical protein MPRI_22060 [Mycobacterium paraintracellulare]BCO55094.1 hypothetical protein MINTM005_03380 [Mycobacterium intracellulare]BCP34965.1 hypothetical protein MINTMi198_03350 [Mycobacterium intracellulare M.i.198]BCO39571.1 hypothetical protein MINTM001_07100 [Mycobacterium paraintracellulare]BCO60473.1 hypothetical protein MINTM006_04230 [Mycobacterium intracellulare]